jgi:hypothetical protein
MADRADTPHLHVEFLMVAVPDVKATREKGRPIFQDVEHCRIRWTGDKGRELIEPAHQFVDRDPQTNMGRSYAQKYPLHYQHFKAQLSQEAVNGTPLSELPFLTEAKRAELRALNVMTAEGLAGMDGAFLQKLGMGARELKNQARAWIDKAAGGAVENRMAEELAARDTEIEALKAQMALVLASQQAVITPAPVAAVVDDGPSPFDTWDVETLKTFILERTGRRPAGNPGHKTLVKSANEIVAAERAQDDAA